MVWTLRTLRRLGSRLALKGQIMFGLLHISVYILPLLRIQLCVCIWAKQVAHVNEALPSLTHAMSIFLNWTLTPMERVGAGLQLLRTTSITVRTYSLINVTHSNFKHLFSLFLPFYASRHFSSPPPLSLFHLAVVYTEKCDEALASPLPHTAFTSSSVFSNGYAPGYAKLNRRGGEFADCVSIPSKLNFGSELWVD